MGTACYVKGGDKVLEEFEKQLGIGVGETSHDGLFRLLKLDVSVTVQMLP